MIGPGAVYEVNSPGYPRKYPSREKCSRTFAVVPGTKLTVECDVFRVKGKSGCREDRVDMVFKADGKSESITFCNRDLDQGYVVVAPHTFAFNVDWKFRSDKRKR